MTTWYKAWFGKIEPIEVLGETDKFIKLPSGRKESKDADWYWIRPTREDAKTAMIAQYELDLIECRRKAAIAIEFAEKKLTKAKSAE